MKVAFILLACLLTWGQAAWGHAALIRADPAPGAVLERAPDAAVLTFNEPVSVTALRLFGPEGQPADVAPSRAGGSRIRVPLPAGAPQGPYLLSWRVVSADGHPVGGTLDYSVGVPGGSAMTAGAAAAPGAREAAIWLGRWLGYACLFACVGAALFSARDPSDRQGWARPLVWTGLALLPLNLGLQGLDLLDLPGAALLGWAPWSTALASRYAWTLGLSALALLASAGALRARKSWVARGCAGAGLALAGAALAASGHAGTAPPQWLSRPLVVLHVVTAAAWLGALVPLTRLLKPGPAGWAGQPLLAWFSRWIAPAVILLLASGTGLTLLQLDQPGDLWRTSYGIVLSVKLALVCGLLAIAAFNRWRCTGPALAGDRAARGRLRRSIGVEAAVALVLLGVVSLWRFTPPPRSLDAVVEAHARSAGSRLASFELFNGRARARVMPSGGAWLIELRDAVSGKPLEAQGLTLALSNPQAGIEPLRRAARRQQDGRWRVDMGSLPLSGAGRWQLSIDILVDDFEQTTLEGMLSP